MWGLSVILLNYGMFPRWMIDDRVRKGHIILPSATCLTKVLKDVALLSHLCGPAYKVL